MRTFLLLGVLTALATLLTATGCQTVTKTPDEVNATYKQVLDMDARQLADDWNFLWLADRQYRLTRWHMR
jgi:hypothetical protein